MFLIGRVWGLIAMPRPPRVRMLEPSVRCQLPKGADIVNQSALEGGEGEGWPSSGAACGDRCAVKYGETEAGGCLIGIKSDTLI